jgi:hypothetical protein
MPSFGGASIFGEAVEFQGPDLNPPQMQQTAYAGLSGIEELPLGLRGAWTTASGRLFGDTRGDLETAEQNFRNFYDMQYYTLVLSEADGIAYDRVRLESFVTVGKPAYDFLSQKYTRRYTAKFFHPLT